jgi:hypothetical protein
MVFRGEILHTSATHEIRIAGFKPLIIAEIDPSELTRKLIDRGLNLYRIELVAVTDPERAYRLLRSAGQSASFARSIRDRKGDLPIDITECSCYLSDDPECQSLTFEIQGVKTVWEGVGELRITEVPIADPLADPLAYQKALIRFTTRSVLDTRKENKDAPIPVFDRRQSWITFCERSLRWNKVKPATLTG